MTSRIVGAVYHLGHGGPTTPVRPRVATSLIRADRETAGLGVITGVVSIKADPAQPAIPARRLVLCMDNRTKKIVRDTWSAADGSFMFSGLVPLHRYLILSEDNQETYNDVVAARIEATIQ